MNTNLAHDVFIKKSESLKLAADVEEFLKAQNKDTPDLVPFGYSELAHKRNTEGYNAQSAMREIMFNAVHEAKKVETPVAQKFLTTEQQRLASNKSARTKAFKNGSKEFVGQCTHHGQQIFKIKSNGKEHICIVCRDKHSKMQTERRKNGYVK